MKPATATTIVVAGQTLTTFERDSPARRLVRAFFRARNVNTLRAYQRDLADFAAFVEVADAEAACAVLLKSSPGRANEVALDYRDHLVLRKLEPTTVNRRLSALRAVVKLARTLGMVTWHIEIEGIDTRPYRDTRGPQTETVQAMLEQLGSTAKGTRDEAIVRLLHDRGLRRGEVVGLDREHFDPLRGVFALGKGRKEREWLTLPDQTRDALAAWIEIRGDEAGPLFTALDNAHFGHRLTGQAIYMIIRKLGARVGVVTRPHGLRHSAITRSLKQNNGNVVESQKFSRHARVETLMIYNDSIQDTGGRVAAMVALPKRQATSPTPEAFDLKAWAAFGRYVEKRWPGKDPKNAGVTVVAGFFRRLRTRGSEAGLRRAAEAVCSRMQWWAGVVPPEVTAALD